jgi:hypothetical protein
VHSAEGAGGASGGPCVVPPSANASADIETTRRQAAKNLVGFVIVRFSFSLKGRRHDTSDRLMLLSGRIIALLAILTSR